MLMLIILPLSELYFRFFYCTGERSLLRYLDFSVAVFGPRRSAALLVKNGVNVVAASEHPASGLSGTSNAVILTLEAGDLVSVQLWPTFQVFDNENHHTTFSGFLLFPM